MNDFYLDKIRALLFIVSYFFSGACASTSSVPMDYEEAKKGLIVSNKVRKTELRRMLRPHFIDSVLGKEPTKIELEGYLRVCKSLIFWFYDYSRLAIFLKAKAKSNKYKKSLLERLMISYALYHLEQDDSVKARIQDRQTDIVDLTLAGY